MAINQRTLLLDNIFAITTALSIKVKGEYYKPALSEIDALKSFKGFGALKSVLYPLDIPWDSINGISVADKKMEDDIKAFHHFITDNFNNYEEIWSNIKESVLTSFYTPESFVDAQIKNIYLNNNNNINSFLDPSAGNGVYVQTVLNYYPDAKITAVEKDYLSAFILSARFNGNDNITVFNKGLEDINFTQKFDLISSNIPFGNFKVRYPQYSNDVTDKIHNFFFYHSSELLNEGGVLSFLTSTGVFNSPSNKPARLKMSNNLRFLDILSLPNNLFDDAGTEVSTHLVQAIKNTNQNENQILQNNLFVNTSTVLNIPLNHYIENNFTTSFLETPQRSTNPYGKEEFNYKMDITETLSKLNDNIHSIPQLEIIEANISSPETSLFFERFPFQNISFENVPPKREEQLLRSEELLDDAWNNNFYALGIVTANYKGVIHPIATISRINIFDSEKQTNTKKYLIDSYTPHILLSEKNGFISGKDFKTEFLQFTKNLEDLSRKYSLSIDIKEKDETDSIEFRKYFLNSFNQPKLSVSYETDFYNFNFHKLIIPGMLVLNRDDEPSTIKQTFNDPNMGRIYELEELKTNSDTRHLLQDYLYLYDSYSLFLQAEKENDRVEIFRERLNKHYDTFVNNHGFINENKTIATYDSNYYPLLKSLENGFEIQTQQIDLFSALEEKRIWKKADIFTSSVDTIEEIIEPNLALAKSFNVKGKIDLPYISELTGLPSESIMDILDSKIIMNPLTNEFELKNLFFSGEIKKKIANIEKLNNPTNSDLISELKSILPSKVPFEAINMQMGVRWFPQELLKEFLKGYFEQDFKTIYNPNLDSFFVEPELFLSSYGSAKYRSFNYQSINNRFIRPEDLIFNAFYDIYPIVTYKDALEVTQTDQEATKYYKREITNLRKDFQMFILKLPQETKETLTTIYNDKFNSLVVAQFDTDILDFSEFNLKALGINEIYNHQKRAVWKSISNEGGIVDHEVGLGKTFEIIAATHFGKKLGIYNKPVILGLKANVPEIAHAYRALLPNANILFASSKDYSVKERETFLNKIKNNNYDAVIMSHEQFGSIPQDMTVEEDIVSQELQDVEDNLFNAKNLDISKKQLRGLEIKKKNLSVRMDFLHDRIRKQKDENVLSFSSIGIDHIVIDEAHKFKNLMFQTKHNRVAGLGDPDGSQRANNLLTAIRTIQKNTKTGEYGATFFSGTPISNSITELYLLQKYLTPITLSDRGIYNFDAWCSNFAEKSIEFETNMVNKIIPKERFRYFVNLPELSLMYNNMSDVMTGDLAKIDRPNKNEQLLLNEQTPLQKRFYIKLAKFLDNKQQEILNLDTPLNIDSQSTAISLVAMNLAFKASLDMRMISSQYIDEKDSKVNNLVKSVLDSYRKFEEQKGVQIIFTDISTPKKKLTFEQLEENYQNNIFTSLYDDIKYKLIVSNVPEVEIAFIQDFNTEKKKKSLMEKMNSGEIRVLIGGTENAGTGLNVQSKLSNIWHLSIPWKPSELEQRNGRGFRKGNLIAKEHNNNKIDIAICATKNTLDNYKVDLNKNKQNFINQLKGASIGEFLNRTLDEGSMDENTGMSLAELQAQLTGDTTMLDKFKIDNKIKDLEQEKVFILSKNSENQQKLNSSLNKIEDLKEAKKIFTTDLETYTANLKVDENGQRINEPNYIGLVENPTNDQISNFLVKINTTASDYHQDTQKKIAEMFGFQLYVTNHIWEGVQFKIKNLDDPKMSYTINDGKLNTENQSAALSFFVRCFDAIQRKVNNADENIAKEERKSEAFKLNTNNVFPHEDLLDELIKESEVLDTKIREGSQEINFSYETKTVVIDAEEVNFKVISDLKILDRAILYEHLGNEHQEIGFFCTNPIREFTRELADMENSGVAFINQNLDLKTHQHFIKIRINNYDKMYVAFDELYSKEILSGAKLSQNFSEGKYPGKAMLINNNQNYYCYNDSAGQVANILNIPIQTCKGTPYITIPANNIENILPQLISRGLSVGVVNLLEEPDNIENSKGVRL